MAGYDTTAWRRTQGRLVVWDAALYLAAAALAAKGALLPLEEHNFAWFARWSMRLAIVVGADLAVAALLAAALWGAAWLCAPGARAWRLWRAGSLCLLAAVGLYHVAAALGMKQLGETPTVRFWLLEWRRNAWPQTLEGLLHPYWIAWALLAGAGALAAPALVRRLSWVRRDATAGGWGLAAALGAMVLFAAGAQRFVATRWKDPDRWERKLAASPHFALLASSIEELRKDETPEDSLAMTGASSSAPCRSVSPRLTTESRRDLPTGQVQNVLFVVLYSASSQYLDLFGGRYPATPKLAARAAERGVVFENFYTCQPHSSRSWFPLFTGRPPSAVAPTGPPSDPRQSLPGVLLARGYRVGFVAGKYWYPAHSGRRYVESLNGELIDAHRLDRGFNNLYGVSDQKMFEAALQWIDRDRERPFFLATFVGETRDPLALPDSPPDWNVKDDRLSQFLTSVHLADTRIDWLLNELAARGLDRSTLVVVTADRGEPYGADADRARSHTVYEARVRVPLLMLSAEFADAPRRIAGPRRQFDVPRTIARLVGAPATESWRGADLLESPDAGPAPFASFSTQPAVGVRDGRHKLLYFANTDEAELYDLAADPQERTNLAGSMPELESRLRRQALGYLRHVCGDASPAGAGARESQGVASASGAAELAP